MSSWPSWRRTASRPEREPYAAYPGGSRICFIRDPDDYRIELIERRGDET